MQYRFALLDDHIGFHILGFLCVIYTPLYTCHLTLQSYKKGSSLVNKTKATVRLRHHC